MYDNKELMHRFAKVGRMAMGGRGRHGHHGLIRRAVASMIRRLA